MSETGIGASVKRKEDGRFIVGRGNFTDDIDLPKQLYAFFVRSPHAHAKIKGIDKTAAEKAPGVVAVFTGQDMVLDKVGGLPCGWQIHSKDGSAMIEPPHLPLAADIARFVGGEVAVVVAETKAQAKEAASLVDVDYEELPAVVNTADAAKDGAPQVWPEAKNNVCYDWHIGDKAKTDAAFAGAHKVVELRLINNRLVPNAMEPRAYIGSFDPVTGDYTLYTTCQNPHVIRLLMGAYVLGIPEHKLKVISPDVGGGFGSKIFHYAEEATVTWASRRIGRPVKWTAERSESFMSDAHGRDHVTFGQLALDANGKFLGLRVQTTANLGAYLSTFGPSVPTYLYGTLLAGTYTTPAIYCEVKAVFTNTVPVDAYRGAGRPEATFVLERLVDIAAREMGIDRVEIRRKNFIRPDQFPYETPVALTYDTGNYAATLDLALEKSDWAGFEKRRGESKKRGKLRGIGIATYIEACGLAPSAVAGQLGARAGLYESGQVRVHPTGSVTVYTGSHSHGQGHETTFAQIVSDYLGIPIENIEVVHGDTSKIAFGMGTYGSRSVAVGGTAIVKATKKIIEKGKKVAAHLFEASAGDVEFVDGAFRLKGTDKAIPFGDIALASYVPHKFPHEQGVEPGLDETAFYDPANFTYPAGCHICEVEVDPDTGVVELVKYTVADDFGRIINPMIVDGQVHGGIAQGVGQALLEGCLYDDETGQLLTGSYMNYTMPRAADLPFFETAFAVTECTHNELGVKGCGEAGAIGAPACVINAVTDAIGVRHIDMPATSEKVWRAVASAR